MRFFDFFAGIGGFRLGMAMAGHECVGHCEIDEAANRSYIAMHNPKESEVFFDDIRTIKPADMPECEVYCFGFPCQAFSIAGRRGGFEDTRGTLFFEVMRLAAVRKPALLFAENVKGLLNHGGGDTFETIIRSMDGLGYTTEWQLCNSQYFGVPQNRERVFIVGHLRGRGGPQIFPITRGSGQIAKVGSESKTNNKIKTLNTKKYDGTETYQQDRIYDSDGIAPALMQGKSDLNIRVVNGSKVRKLTPRECFRLQGFPDEYFDRAASVNGDTALYKQAGNSVTVNVIYEIAKRLKLDDDL